MKNRSFIELFEWRKTSMEVENSFVIIITTTIENVSRVYLGLLSALEIQLKLMLNYLDQYNKIKGYESYKVELHEIVHSWKLDKTGYVQQLSIKYYYRFQNIRHLLVFRITQKQQKIFTYDFQQWK